MPESLDEVLASIEREMRPDGQDVECKALEPKEAERATEPRDLDAEAADAVDAAWNVAKQLESADPAALRELLPRGKRVESPPRKGTVTLSESEIFGLDNRGDSNCTGLRKFQATELKTA